MSKTIEQKHLIGGQEYTLTYNFNTLCNAEGATGQSMMRVDDNLSMRTISGLFWAALQDKHPMERKTANLLIDQAGPFVVADWVTEGIGDYMTGVMDGDKKAAA